MKKLFTILSLALMALSASAQFSSETLEKRFVWYARIGVTADNLAGGNDLFKDSHYIDGESGSKNSIGSKAGMDIDWGFMMRIGKNGLYWGAEVGIGTRGATCKETGYDRDYDYESGQYTSYKYTSKGSVMTWNAKLNFFNIGYKYSLPKDIKLDAHFGLFTSCDFAGGTKYDWGDGDSEKISFDKFKDEDWHYNPFDFGMQIGIGAWWKQFNFDITYQRGFIPAARLEANDKDLHIFSSNVMFRVGYAF